MIKMNEITIKKVVKVMRDLISSLFLMHVNGIFHLDIKPLNIMYHQNTDRFIFIDFGASKIIPDNNVFGAKYNLYGHTCTI